MKYRKILNKYNAYFKKAVFHSRENIKVVYHCSENISWFKLYFICIIYDKYTKQHRIGLQYNHYTNGTYLNLYPQKYKLYARVKFDVLCFLH